ncbi:disease resistance protein (TIR-NBS-LRR class) [Medicago truncatula]|uniref:Disease resistance protein (TIR-NBS-LRR class) n=1 Tax=Medicago truncatula TaxID=3880 RepID=A0A072UGG9_MEDTR|nr:disease resistance protein (TIR-NBS-LRR class) [Medicago truncatula]
MKFLCWENGVLQKEIKAFVDDELKRGDEIPQSLVRGNEGSLISLIIFSQDYASSCWCLEEHVTIRQCREKYGQIVIPLDCKDSSRRRKTFRCWTARTFEKAEDILRAEGFKGCKLVELLGVAGSKGKSSFCRIVTRWLGNMARLEVSVLRQSTGKIMAQWGRIVARWCVVTPVSMMILLVWIIALLGFLKVAASLLRRGQERRDGAGLIPEVELKGVAEREMPNNTPQLKYDVFVSFRGEDIRHSFLSHLVKAFPRKQINAFVDDALTRGDDISHSLFEAIEGSPISLVIFSKNYASSHWCLDELVKIIECKEKYGQIVLPIFYGVKPTNVRHQKKSYENAFSKLEKMHNSSQVQIWRDALKISCNSSGITSSSFPNDAVLVEEITKVVLMRLSELKNSPVNSKELVGIDKPIADLNSLLKKESEQVRVIGIWGMGGIGKTTIAEEIFSQNRSDYDGCCFLEKVSERLKTHGGVGCLKESLLSELLKESVKELSGDIKRRISRMKVLIVLDDVKETDQLEMLFGTLDWFQSDSRIILTSRDKQVLRNNEVEDDDIYEVGVLDSSEALVLFNSNAFKQSHLEMEYYELSKSVVNYAKGIPLVLKVLAHMLRGKKKEVWESQLDKLRRLPVQKVYDAMRLSYDDLDRLEQKYFLDIACFFNGLDLKVDYMKHLLKDCDSDNYVAGGLETLKDKALITISEDNVISMHDILQEMGWEIVRQESSDLGKRSRLWNPDEIYDVLKNDKDLINLKEVRLSYSMLLKELPDFSKAINLKVLNISSCYQLKSVHPSILSLNRLEQLGLSWCPINALPSSFGCQRKLEILVLRYSDIEIIPSSIKNLTRLRKLDIRGCLKLVALPELPSSVETLLVKDSFSLKTVLFPSTVAEQFKENKKSVEFWNCENLDESSLINVGLNVQINLMKYANFGSDEAMYVYPGSSIPEWLEYKTTKDDMIIDLSQPRLSPLLGFVFCIVFPKCLLNFSKFILKITTIEGDNEKDGVDINLRSMPLDIYLDHVCMIQDQRCSGYLTRIAKNQTSFKIKVTAMSGFIKVKLKGFGMSPINQSTYQNLIQQMEYECA